MKFLKSLFGGSRKERVMEFVKQQEEAKAREVAKAASVNAADSDTARAARDARLRKLARANTLGSQGGQRGGAQLLFKTLMGQ